MVSILTDRVHRLPRLWSNRQIAQFAPLFTGDVVNVSGWTDTDKEGGHYREYFANASSYTITNFKSEARGYQGQEGEIFLDLTKTIPGELRERFDVVFNHTTLEHIYEIKTAFASLCTMSKDIVILVVPFLQQYHASYGDFWRLSPLAIKYLFEENCFSLLYSSFNEHRWASVYVFAIASRYPERWQNIKSDFTVNSGRTIKSEPYIGCNAIPRLGNKLFSFLKKSR